VSSEEYVFEEKMCRGGKIFGNLKGPHPRGDSQWRRLKGTRKSVISRGKMGRVVGERSPEIKGGGRGC